MKKNVFSIFSVLSVLAFLVTGFFTSCEVGLGEAVDTYPPTLTLDYPANDGITVMNTFQMRGEAKDETYVKTVEVIVKTIPKSNKETAKELIRYAAEIDSQAKTWSCAVNQKDENGTFQIPDGEYTFQIICTDSSDRTTELSRVYKIDNTAPVVVLKRPGLDDSYGRTIKVTGDISDENELSALYFTAYRNKGTEEAPDFELIGTQRYENISGVGLELIVGRYFDSEEGLSDNEKNQKAIYDAYYDSTIGGSQSFYCMVEVADSAKEYTGTLDLNAIPSGTSADSLKPAAGSYTGEVSGNLSTCYYLYSSIYDDIYSKNGFNITNSDLVSIYNGSFTETSKVKIAKVKETLEKYAINTSAISASVSSFSLNPDNSPRFKVLGLGDASNVKSVIKNSDINIEISQGRDGISLRSNSIRVELQEAEALANGTYKKTGNNIVLLESYNKYTEMLSSDDDSEASKGELYKTYWTSLKKDEDNVFNDEATKITFGIELNGLSPLSEVYKTGKKYYVSVEGCDYEDNEIESAASDYILAFQNGSAPIINVTGGTEDNSVQRTPVDFSTSRSLSVSGAPIFNYSGTLDSDSGIEDLKVFYYITVKDEKPAKGETVKTWSTKKEDYADRTAVITENTDSSVEVPFLWSLEIPEGSEDFAELYEMAQEDGKDLSDGLYLYTIYFYGYDGSQKTSTVSQRVHVDTQKPVVTMDGVTPLVEYEEASDLPYEDMAVKTDYVNGTVTFKGTVSDNYTLNNTIARAYLLEADGTKTSETAFATEEFGDSMSFSFVIDTSSVTEPTDMLVEIESTDKAGNTGDVVTKKVRIDQRTDEPRFIPSNADKTILDVTKLNESTNMFGKTSNNKIMGTVTDDDGVWGWQAYYSAGTSAQTASEWKLFTSSTGIESTSANISVDLSKIPGFTEGIYKIKIEVKDIVKGKGAVANSQVTSSDEFFIAIDEAAPALTITTEQNSYVSGTEGATVKGKFSDGSQEIKSFKRTVYRVETTTNNETGESSVKETAISENEDILSKLSATSGSAIKNGLEFTDVIDLNGEENPGRVEYYITDKYDRESKAEFTYIIDNEDPTVSLSADLVDTTVFLAKGNAIKGISGTARDNIENGLSKVEYIISASETAAGITETDWTAFTGTYKWNSTINFGETTEGKKYVYIRAHDAAGNKTDAANYACIPVIIDAEAPVFDEDSFKVEYIDETGGDVPSSEDGATRYANKLFKITGKVTDEYYKDLTCSIQTGTFDKTSLGKTGGDFTWTLNGLTEGSKNYVFTATDQAGQTTTKTVTIVIDYTAPTPKLGLASYYSLTGTTYTVNEKITFTGTVTDANELKSTVISAVKADDATETPVTAGGILPITAANASNFTESFDTTALEDDVYIFTVTSTDVAGNVGTAQIRVSIDQETDKPLITFSNADSAVTVLSDVNEQRNLFGKTSNNKILGSVSDDDKVGTITVQYTTDFDHAAAEIPADSWHTIGTYTATGSTYNLSIELKDEGRNELPEGDYRLRIIAEDSKNPEADGTVPASKQTIAGPFYIGIDEGLPVLDINIQDGELLAAGQNVTITGTVEDGSGKVTLTRTRSKQDGTVADGDTTPFTVESYTNNTGKVTWTDGTVANPLISYTSSEVLTYVATDKYGRTSTKSFRYDVDDADPTLTVTSPADGAYLGAANGNTTLAFKGTAADILGTGKSGVKEVIYRVITVNSDGTKTYSAGTETVPDYDNWLSANGTTTWEVNVELGSASVTKEVELVSVDNAGRYSTVEKRTVIVDGAAPSISNIVVKDKVNAADREVSVQDGTYYVQTGYTVTGKLTEEHLVSFKNTVAGANITPETDGTFTYTVTSPASGQHAITLEAVDQAGQRASVNLNIYYDTTNPTPSLSITPVVITDGANARDDNVNGNVTLKATAVDDDKIVKSHLKIIDLTADSTGNTVVLESDTVNPSTINRVVPLSDCIGASSIVIGDFTISDIPAAKRIKDKNAYRIELTSTDRSGRTGTDHIDVFVDQDTDKPAIKISNATQTLSTVSGVTASENLFGQTTNNKLLGTITDDDGISSIKIEYAPVTNIVSGAIGSWQTLKEVTSSGTNGLGSTYNLTAELKNGTSALAEGLYKIRIQVLDITSSASVHPANAEFFIGIDNGAPQLNIATTNGKWQPASFTVSGTAVDSALKSVSRYATTDNVNPTGAPTALTFTDGAWTDTLTVERSGTVIYVAEDNYGQKSSSAFTWLYDADAPTVAGDWTAEDKSAWSNNSAQKFSVPLSDEYVNGSALDQNTVSGISSVTIKVDSESPTSMVMGNPYQADDTAANYYGGKYYWYNSNQILTDGAHTVKISAEDGAGNKLTDFATYTLNIDTVPPVYAAYSADSYVHASKPSLTGADVDNLGDVPFTLSVKPTDATSGVRYFIVYDGNTNVTDNVTLTGATLENHAEFGKVLKPSTGTTFTNGAEYTFELAGSLITTGTHAFYVKAIDQATNSIQQGVSVSVDVDAPTITLNETAPYVTVNSARKYNGIVKISGRAMDETKLGTTGAISYEIFNSDGTTRVTPLDSEHTPATASGNMNGSLSYDWEFRIDTTGLTHSSGTYKIKVTASDDVGNTVSSDFITLNVDQTTDRPAVKLSNGNVKVTTETQISSDSVTSDTASENKGNLFGMGNDSIFASATDDDGIASIKLYVTTAEGVTTEIKKPGDSTKDYFTVTGAPTSYAMEINLKEILPIVAENATYYAGSYKLSLAVQDTSTGLSNSDCTLNNTDVKDIWFAYDDDLPTINVTKINDNGYTDSMWAAPESTIYITVSDSSSADGHTNLTVINDSIQWWDGNLGKYVDGTREAGESASCTWDGTSSSWVFASKNIDKTYKRKFVVSDKYGRSSNKEILYAVDTEVPVFNSNYIALFGSSPSIDNTVTAANGVVVATSKDYWFNSDAVKVIGRGAAGAQALVEEHPDSVTITVGTTDYPVNPGEYNKFSTTISFEDGVNTIEFHAQDKGGLNAVPATTTVKVDTQEPVITSVTASDNAINIAEREALATSPFYITVVASDANGSKTVSGIKEFKVLRGSTDVTDYATVYNSTNTALAAKTSGIYADGTYCIRLSKDALVTGNQTFYVQVSDLAGNTASLGTSAVSIDVTEPEMSWNAASPYVSVNDVRKYNGFVTISGTVNDETLLATDDTNAAASDSTRSVSWEVKTSAGASLSPAYTGYASLGGTKTSGFTFQIDTTKVTATSGTYRVYITAKDAVGNSVSKAGEGSGAGVEYIELAIDQETDKPKVILSNADASIKAYNAESKGSNLFGMGSNVIYGTVSDDDGIASIVLKIDGSEVENYFTVSGNPTSYTMEIDLSKVNGGNVIDSGNHTLSIEVTDSTNAGSLTSKTYTVNKDSVKNVYFAYDNDLPTISVVKCNDKDYSNNMWGKAAFDVYISVADGTDLTGENLTLKCSDIKKSESGSTGTYSDYTPSSTETIAWKDSVEISGSALTNVWKCPTVNKEGYFQRTYTVSDKYGRYTTSTINYVVDSTAPAFNAEYITVQGSSNSGTSAIKITELDANTWFNSSAIKIAGTGSSYTGNDTAIKEQNMESLVINANDTTYPVNTGTNNKFSSTIDFEDGSAKTFSLTATDKAGNTTSTGSFSVNVDTVAPENVSASITDLTSSVTNKTSLTLSVSASDATSGVKYVYIGTTPGFPIASAIYTETIASPTSGAYSKTNISLDISSLSDGTYTIYVKMADLAGNLSSEKSATFTVNSESKTEFILDTTKPVVKITSHANASTVNKTITLSGSVVDSNIASDALPTLYYSKDNSTWTAADSSWISGASIENGQWSFKFDTTKINETTVAVDYYFAVAITDKAGNTNDYAGASLSATSSLTEKIKVTVDQDSDRPEISFNNVTLSNVASGDTSASAMTSSNPVWIKTSTIYGTIKDDDGIASVKYSTDGTNYSSTYTDLEGSTQDVYENGSWQFVLPDGAQTIYFKVTDEGGTTFTSSTGKTAIDLDSPKFKDSKSNHYGYRSGSGVTASTNVYNTVLYAKVDTTQPAILYKYYTTDSSAASLTADDLATMDGYTTAQIESAGWKSLAQISSEKFGGPDSSFYVWAKASDASGIESLKLQHTFDSSKTIEAFAYKQVDPVTTSGVTTPGYYIGVYKVETSSGNGNNDLKVIAKDAASGTTTETVTVNLDNTGPTITLDSHKDGATVFGSIAVTISGFASDSNDLSEFYYCVTSDTSEPATSSYTAISDYASIVAWTINFDDATSSNVEGGTSYHDKYLNKYIDAWVADNTYDTLTTLYFWYYAEDEFGNTSTPVKCSLVVNPQADKPVVTVVYPSQDETLGGTIRITGTATISAKEIDSVWVQIDPTYDGTFNTSGWQSEMETIIGENYATYGYKVITETISGSAEGGSDVTVTGIKASNTSFWNLTVNVANELQSTHTVSGEEVYWPIGLKVFAVSSTGKKSDEVTLSFNIDPDNPLIGNSEELRLVQYDSEGNEVRSKKYESDMWISGIWYLVGSIEDSSGIRTVNVTKEASSDSFVAVSSITSGTSSVFGESYSDMIKAKTFSTTSSGYSFSIPVGSDADNDYGSLSYTIYAVENTDSNLATTQTISLNYDNKVPDFTTTLSATGNKIQQSNYTYTLDGQFDESGSGANQSGFDKIAVFFTRTLDETTYVVDPMVSMGADGTSNREEVNTTNFSDGAVDSSDGLYWKKVTTSAAVTSATISVTPPSNARKGGLCKVNDVIYTIDSVGASSVTLTSAPTSTSAAVDIYFATALVIDHEVTESGFRTAAWSSTFSNSTDDGDQMLEGVTHSGALYTWTASINSSNILDGPLTIHFVAFDKAGNVTKKSYEGTVSNNTPRIARVSYGTDNDASGTIEDSEMTGISSLYIYDDLINSLSFYGKDANGKNIDSLTIGSSSNSKLTIKGATKVIPEIVGGNGGLGYSYKIGGTQQKIVKYNESGSPYKENSVIATETLHEYTDDAGNSIGTDVTGSIRGTEDGDTDDTIRDLLAIDIFTLELLVNSSTYNASTIYPIEFKIWDKTEGTTFGTDSPCATITLYSKIAITSSSTPSVSINPFYWKSLKDNSIYGSSSASDFRDLQGHIELEADWKNSTAYDSEATSGVYDSDPKVSGIIKFTGSAQDDVMLKKLSITIPGFNSGNELVFATRGDDGAWSESAYSDTNGWGWSLVSDTNDQTNGNVVKWEFYLNTAKIDDVAVSDVTVDAKSYNRGVASIDETGLAVTYSSPTGSESSSTITTSSALSSHYKMDVVPYVSKVYTKLAENKTTNWSVYNRTALGHYPVQSVVSNIETSGDNKIELKTTTSEDVILYGFNLNDDSVAITSGSGDDAVTFTVGNESDALKIDNSTSGQLSFNVASLQTGELSLTVSEISILNNVNDNDAYGSATEEGDDYENWYNRQANGDTNNTLTDDVYFDVWEFNDRVVTPINGLATGINMEINQKTGMLNYAFANGGLYYSMGGNTDTTVAYSADNSYSSYYWAADWDTFAGPCVGFHVDELGYTYSAVSGGDTNSSGSVDKWDLFTSRWGLGEHGTGGTLGGTNNRRLEEIGLKTGGGTYDYSLMKYRFLSPEFASTVDTSAVKTNLYLVYYDALCNQIRFRAGTFSGTSKQNTGGFQDEYTGGTASYYKTANCQVIANVSTGSTFAKSATENVTVAGIEGRTAGQYVDVAVVKNEESKDVVCVVWYDGENNNLNFSYIVDPITNWASLKGNATAASWSDPVTVFSEGGEYCHIVADKDNHLHIAAYAGNGDVMYAYLDTYTSTASTCTVDASGAVGEHLTLDVAVNSKGHSIPYIGYYTSAIKMPKYAYLVDPTIDDSSASFSQTEAGSDSNEYYTGKWEVAVVPSPSKMTTNREDKVNVGVWKTAGVLTNSTTGTSSFHNKTNGYESINWSKTYGNGTANGILGYQISTSTGSCLETAQMR